MVGGSAYEGGPVRVSVGSSTKRTEESDFEVWPGDCNPPDALSKATRFALQRITPLEQAKLKRRSGRLNDRKLSELKEIRREFLR